VCTHATPQRTVGAELAFVPATGWRLSVAKHNVGSTRAPHNIPIARYW